MRDLCDYMKITVPVAMHLDHGSYEDCFKAIEAGFTSIMYDGSHEETFELNLARTAEIVKLCHGKGLSVDQLAKIKAEVGDLPLVLHGGTGIPTDQIKKAISMGISKINVNTDLQVAFSRAERAYVESGKDLEGKNYDPRKFLKPGFDAVTARAKELVLDFGSDGKGWA